MTQSLVYTIGLDPARMRELDAICPRQNEVG
jgi:hypothetical protein